METNIACSLQVTRLRKEKGVTQEELARHLGVTFQAVSKWETGAAFPDIALLPSIARYFGTTIDAVLGYDSVPTESAAALYPAIKGTLERQPPERLYRDVWNLSCLLHEAVTTGGWRGHAAWPVRNRLEDDGFDGWGLSINLEPAGFSLLAKGMTVIGLNEQLGLPAPGQCGKLASLFRRLSDAGSLRVLLTLLERQKGNEDRVYLNLEELARDSGLSQEDCHAAVDRLMDWGWTDERENGESGYSVANHLEALLMPLLAVAGVFHQIR